MSLQPRHAGPGRILTPASFCVAVVLFLSCATFCATASRAQEQQDQSVAEAARQERTRKQAQQRTAKHVYTEEDLKRRRILTPEDRAVVEARKNECAQKNDCAPTPSQNSQNALDTNSQSQQTSLGEVARRYRRQRELQALKAKQSSPFHLSIGSPALASPILPERPAIRPPAEPLRRREILKSETHTNVFLRDPFARVPARPRVFPGVAFEIRPGVRPPVDGVAPAAPKIPSRLAPPAHPFDRPAPAQPVSRAPRIQPTHPFAPLNTHRASSPAAPTNSFPSSKSVTSIETHSSQPAAPPELHSEEPIAPVATVRPLRSSASPVTVRQKSVTVQPGDSLWKLAREFLGRGNRWPELLAANRGIANPNQILAGVRLALPAALARVSSPRTPTGRFTRDVGQNASPTTRVQKGDTLWSVARSHYGHGTLWPCIAGANPSIADANLVFQGQQLVLPLSCDP